MRYYIWNQIEGSLHEVVERDLGEIVRVIDQEGLSLRCWC